MALDGKCMVNSLAGKIVTFSTCDFIIDQSITSYLEIF